MAMMNPYNYSKPKNTVKSDLGGSPVASPVKKELASQKADQYLEARINGAKPEELTYMLYEGLTKFIKKAMLFLEEKNYEKVNFYTQRAQAIVDELRSTLNMDIELSQSLDTLYEYLGHRLMIANIEKDVQVFEETLKIAEDFKETWRQTFNLRD